MEQVRDADLQRHVAAILLRYEQPISSDPRFGNSARLLQRVREVRSRVPASLAGLRALHESHNELVVADALLREDIERLTYEPIEDLKNKLSTSWRRRALAKMCW